MKSMSIDERGPREREREREKWQEREPSPKSASRFTACVSPGASAPSGLGQGGGGGKERAIEKGPRRMPTQQKQLNEERARGPCSAPPAAFACELSNSPRGS